MPELYYITFCTLVYLYIYMLLDKYVELNNACSKSENIFIKRLSSTKKNFPIFVLYVCCM